MLLSTEDSIVALSTPPGEGGIAVLRISGKEAITVANRVFRPQNGSRLQDWKGYTVRYGTFHDSETQEIVDDGLLLLFRAPHSYTGENTVEISCHGGRAITSRLLQALLRAGARLAAPGEFTQRAFLNGRLDLAQAEAVADVIRATTDSSLRVARSQLEGNLSAKIFQLKDDLIGILAAIEVTIDFSDEVGELDYEPLEVRIGETRQGVENLLQTSQSGRILREGMKVAIVGRPNVGKSSLLNALLGTDRAIVTPIAGTTRDLVEESANIQGVPVVLVDTAGMRPTEDLVERIGVERAHRVAETADVVLLVLDLAEGFTLEDAEILRQLPSDALTRLVVALNKCDLAKEADSQKPISELEKLKVSHRQCQIVSAQAQIGLTELEGALLAVGVGNTDAHFSVDTLLGANSVVVANARHHNALESALQSLQEAENTTRQRLPGDFIAIDVRGALDALGLITGETVTEDIIHRIFRDFCVGK